MRFERDNWFSKNVEEVKQFNECCRVFEEYEEQDFVAKVYQIAYTAEERRSDLAEGYKGGFVYFAKLEKTANDIQFRGRVIHVFEKHVCTVDFNICVNDFDNPVWIEKEVLI